MRNVSEILNSMKKMGADIDMDKDVTLFTKLNKFCFELLDSRDDIEYITINYGDIIDNPGEVAEKINQFLDGALDLEKAIEAVDAKLYRNRATK